MCPPRPHFSTNFAALSHSLVHTIAANLRLIKTTLNRCGLRAAPPRRRRAGRAQGGEVTVCCLSRAQHTHGEGTATGEFEDAWQPSLLRSIVSPMFKIVKIMEGWH